jgi:hypothetical protein
LRLKITVRKALGSEDYLVEAKDGGVMMAYGHLGGRKFVALGQNVSKLRRMFHDSSGSSIIESYVFEVSGDV